MEGTWAEGYFADATYTYGYYQELSPSLLRFCLLLQNIMPPPAENFDYCELGFGQGLSLNIHAASGSGFFTGTDFNPDHAAFARHLAEGSGSELSVFDDSFEDLLSRDLPQFDYIGLHGTWSWVSARNRQHIVAFLKKRLKVGGALYISYNSYPGWTAGAPLRQLLKLHDRYCAQGDSVQSRVENAVMFADRLLHANPRYSDSLNYNEERIDWLKKQSTQYITHEYLNADWAPMYFTEVADTLAEAKLSYAASASAAENIPELSISAEAQAFLRTVNDPVMYQQVRDYFTNEPFRKDIFMRGGISLTSREQRELLLQERFVLLRHPSEIPPALNVGMGSIRMDSDIYQAVLVLLAQDSFAPKLLQSLLAQLDKSIPLGVVVNILAYLIGSASLSPCQPERAAGKNRKTAHACNATLCKMARSHHGVKFLASPVTGGGVNVPRIVQLFLDAENNGLEACEHARNIFATNGELIIRDGKTLEDQGEVLAHLAGIYAKYRETYLPLLKALDIPYSS